MLLKKTLSSIVKGRKMSSLLMKHIEAERNKLLSSPPHTLTNTSSTKTFHTERGQYTLIVSYEPSKSRVLIRNSNSILTSVIKIPWHSCLRFAVHFKKISSW